MDLYLLAVVNVAYNWTVLGTKGAVEKCFKGDSVENGMSGRVLFAKMPSARYEYMPNYGGKVQLDEEKILQAVHILSSVDGFIDTPRLRRSIETWCNAKADGGYRSKNKRLYDELPDFFTLEMLQEAKPDAKLSALREMTYCWKRGGLVIPKDKNSWEKAKLHTRD